MIIDQIVKQGLCMGCGVCVAACPSRAIHIEKDHRKGLLVPVLDEHKCNQCGMCLQVCPGAEVNFYRLSKTYLDTDTNEDTLGWYKSCYFGHACDNDIRYKSSSGGLITALLVFALDRGIIDAALVMIMSPNKPMEPMACIADTSDKIIAASGSKYCPTSMGAALEELTNREGKFAVVGLPCQMHGIRKLEEINCHLRQKIVLHCGLFCANNNSFLATEYFLKKYDVCPDHVTEIKYRSNGWPGFMLATLHDGFVRKFRRGTTEPSTVRRRIFSSAFHYDFMMPRCLLCPDLTCEMADISFGDPWNKRFLEQEKTGKSMIISRNCTGEDLLSQAQSCQAIELEKTDALTVISSQNICFKENVGARIFMRKIMGRAIPIYKGKKLSVTIKGIVQYSYYIMSYLTHIRNLWPFLCFIRYLRFIIIRVLRLLSNGKMLFLNRLHPSPKK